MKLIAVLSPGDPFPWHGRTVIPQEGWHTLIARNLSRSDLEQRERIFRLLAPVSQRAARNEADRRRLAGLCGNAASLKANLSIRCPSCRRLETETYRPIRSLLMGCRWRMHGLTPPMKQAVLDLETFCLDRTWRRDDGWEHSDHGGPKVL